MKSQQTERITSRFQLGAIVAFLAAITAPSLAMLFGNVATADAYIAATEQRLAAPFPPVSAALMHPVEFARAFERFYNDHFPLRPLLVTANAWADVMWLRTTSSTQVVIGRRHMLFYDSEVTYRRGAQPLNDADVHYLAAIFESRQRWLAAQGIHYLVVFAPNKSSIYPEDLPPWATIAQPISSVDRMTDFLRANTKVPFVDLRDPVRAGKGAHKLYSFGDTHWNVFGAYLGYRAIVSTLQRWYPRITPVALGDQDVVASDAGPLAERSGDLIGLLGLKSVWPDDAYTFRVRYDATEHPAAFTDPYLSPGQQPTVTDAPQSSGPRAVVFSDSFGRGLKAYLAPTFRHALFYNIARQTFDMRAVELERPNIVIQEFAERRLTAVAVE